MILSAIAGFLQGTSTQHATRSEKPTRFAPKAIVYVTGDEDVLKIVNWARANKAAIACRSDGHQ